MHVGQAWLGEAKYGSFFKGTLSSKYTGLHHNAILRGAIFLECQGMLCAVTSVAGIQGRNVDPNIFPSPCVFYNECFL